MLAKKVHTLERDLRIAQQWRMVRELEEEVSQIRGLPVKRHVEMAPISRNETRALVLRLIEQDMPESVAIPYGHALALLGAVEPGTSLRSLLIDLYAEQVGGLYDDRTGRLYVTDLFPPDSRVGRMILAHEICHALQDQNFDFANLPLHARNNDDAAFAILSVIEGDATLLMIEYMSKRASLSWLLELPRIMSLDQDQLNRTPPFWQYLLLFPYLGGLEMTQTASLEIPDARNALLRHPPRSTEQVLHPEKYLASPADEPVSVTLPYLGARLGPQWQLRTANTLGEAGLRAILLPRNIPLRLNYFNLANPLQVDADVSRAAAGWGGDRWALWMPEGTGNDAASTPTAAVLHWRSVWDTARDAKEFMDYVAEKRVMELLGSGEGRTVQEYAPDSARLAENLKAAAAGENEGGENAGRIKECRAWVRPADSRRVLLARSGLQVDLLIAYGPGTESFFPLNPHPEEK